MQPVSLPLAAADIIEFHAAQLAPLMHICGTKERIARNLSREADSPFTAKSGITCHR